MTDTLPESRVRRQLTPSALVGQEAPVGLDPVFDETFWV